jgi:hypothetical protein
MAKATFTGPVLALGGAAGNMRMPGQPGSGVGLGPPEYSLEIGPSGFWGGYFIPGRGSKDRTGPGSIPGVYAAVPIRTVNQPLSAGNAALTVAGGATAGTPLVNISTYNIARAPVPAITSGISGIGIALDIQIDTATFAANSPTVTLGTAANTWRYRVGQWIALLGGGGASVALYSQITAIGSGTLTVSPAPTTAQAANAGGIALTNFYNPALYGGAATNVSSEIAAGAARISVPEAAATRGVGVTGVASGTGGQVLIAGLDGFGTFQSELITQLGGAGTAWGKKTYDVFLSATPQFTDAGHNYTVVTSDLIGLPMSVISPNSFASMLFGAAGSQAAMVAANYTLVPADQTNPATTTTGDPRGGIQMTANGPATAPGTPLTLNGTNILTLQQILDPLQVALSSGINPGPLLGVPPV